MHKLVNKMTTLCEVKSVAFYRNTNSCGVYLTVKKIGSSETISARITLNEVPPFITDPYLYLKIGSVIGKHKVSEKFGRALQSSEIDRYQLFEITNYDETKTSKDIQFQCDYTTPK